MPRLATIAPFGFADFNPPTLLPVYRELGCRTSQFYRNPARPPDLAEAKRIAADAGVPFDSMHGLFGIDHDPSSPDEAVRARAVRTYRSEGEIARKLDAPLVVVHPGPPVAEQRLITAATRAARVAPMRRTMEQLADIGAELGVVYAIENIPANYALGSDPADLAAWIRDLDHPNVRMCFDTGHAHMTSGMQVMSPCGDVTAYLHVHDNDSTVDDHRIPGDGTLDWDAAAGDFAQLGPDMPAMLELFFPEQQMRDTVRGGLGDQLRRWLALV